MDLINFNGWFLPRSEKSFVRDLELGHHKFEYQLPQRLVALSRSPGFRRAIDIGACVGFWSRDFCRLFDAVAVFEPNPIAIECLKLNLRDYKNWSLYDSPLSNCSELKSYYSSSERMGGGTLNCELRTPDSCASQVLTSRLDDFNFQDVDFIKIDVQGHELEVCLGSELTLTRNSPILCIEMSEKREIERNANRKLTKYLDELGYVPVKRIHKEVLFLKV